MHFSEAELDDPNISGEQGDPDHDVISNLVEYALRTDPTEHSELDLPVFFEPELDTRFAILPVQIDLALKDISVFSEVSRDLGVWTPRISAVGGQTRVLQDLDLALVTDRPAFFEFE